MAITQRISAQHSRPAPPDASVEVAEKGFMEAHKSDCAGLAKNVHKVNDQDPLIAIAHAAAQAHKRSILCDTKAAEARKAGDKTSAIYFGNAQDEAWDISYQLRRSLSCYEAQSALGAAVQLAEAISTLDLGCSSEGGVNDEDKKMLDRLILSALRFLERQNGAGLEALDLGCLRNSNVDIWEPVENRLAELKAEGI